MASEKRKTRLDFHEYQRSAQARRRPLDHSRSNPMKKTPASEQKSMPSASKLRDLDLPKMVEQGATSRDYLRQRQQSPWLTYEQLYHLYFGDATEGSVTVAEKRTKPYDLVMVMKTSDAEDKLALAHKTRHANLVSIIEVFRHEDSTYAVFEHLPISLYYCLRNSRINETTLAAILAQIAQGLEYVEKQGLEHGSLSSSNVLLNVGGSVKILSLEGYSKLRQGLSRDLESFTVIAMELMGGSPGENEPLKVKDPERWPLDSKAVKFLLDAQLAQSLGELLEHPFLNGPWQKKQLGGLVDLALIQTDRLHHLAKDTQNL